MKIKLQILPHYLSILLPALIVVSIWYPEITHYYVSGHSVNARVVSVLQNKPSREVLAQLENISYSTPVWRSDDHIVNMARRLTSQGRIRLLGFPDMHITMPFSEQDLDKGSPTWNLHFSSLVLPEILIKAFKITGDDNYLLAAKEIVVTFASYEQSVWLPKGFLWNDHAVANRIPVLARFWSVYRKSKLFNPDEAKEILQLVVRSGQMLSKPSHFTFSTNHGVMQNLALLHIVLAFPELPETEKFQKVGQQRLLQQMDYYVSSEGVVLEHSAGYHKTGVDLVGMALLYYAMSGWDIPSIWKTKYIRAKKFYAQLRRPDGTLPMYGDTGSGGAYSRPLSLDTEKLDLSTKLYTISDWKPENNYSIYPISGYAIWWYGLEGWPSPNKLSQTVVAWSNFTGHGHKLSDEMSVLFWAGGQSWWTNAGYWPYGLQGRRKALSWEGSNAPHMIGENRKSKRSTRAKYSGLSKSLSLLELEREGPGELQINRQIISIEDSIWVVIDSAKGGDTGTRTIWRTFPNINVERGQHPGQYLLASDATDMRLIVYFIGSGDQNVVENLKENLDIENSVVIKGIPVISNSFIVDTKNQTKWVAAIWAMEKKNSEKDYLISAPEIRHWKSSDDWKMNIVADSEKIQIVRKRDRFSLIKQGKIAAGVSLTDMSGYDKDRESIEQSYLTMEATYDGYRDLFIYRTIVTIIIVILFLIQETIVLLSRKCFRREIEKILRLTSLLFWSGAGVWLLGYYF